MTSDFDFDAIVDRRATASAKWDKYGDRDVIPMWVADMDFACAPPIVEALRRRVDHGIYGYSNPPAGLIDATIAHLQSEYGWKIEPDWLIWLPGLVVGLNVVCRAFGREGAHRGADLSALSVGAGEWLAQAGARADARGERHLALGHGCAGAFGHATLTAFAAVQSPQPGRARLLP
jgi:hypothetical protein